MQKIHTILVLLCLFTITLKAEKWTPETLPMVHLQDARRYICNPDNVLSQQAVEQGDQILQALEKDKGIQTVVVVVKQLEGDDPYQFGMDLSRKYGIGSKKQNSGLIVILATEDRSYQILTGNGLEGTLPDAICRRIQNRVMLPALKQKDWDKAITQTLKSIDNYVRDDHSLQPQEAEAEENMDAFFGFGIAMLILGFCLTAVGLAKPKHKCPKCNYKAMKVVSRQRVRINHSQIWCLRTTRRCPHCGFEKHEYEEEDNLQNGGNIPPIFMGGLGRSGGSGFGGGSFGGSFGGGSFGGGGSGGRF